MYVCMYMIYIYIKFVCVYIYIYIKFVHIYIYAHMSDRFSFCTWHVVCWRSYFPSVPTEVQSNVVRLQIRLMFSSTEIKWKKCYKQIKPSAAAQKEVSLRSSKDAWEQKRTSRDRHFAFLSRPSAIAGPLLYFFSIEEVPVGDHVTSLILSPWDTVRRTWEAVPIISGCIISKRV